MACVENLAAGVVREITQALVADGVAPADADPRARAACDAGCDYLNAQFVLARTARRAAQPPVQEPVLSMEAYRQAFDDLRAWALVHA
jgi:hypothetical protein